METAEDALSGRGWGGAAPPPPYLGVVVVAQTFQLLALVLFDGLEDVADLFGARRQAATLPPTEPGTTRPVNRIPGGGSTGGPRTGPSGSGSRGRGR